MANKRCMPRSQNGYATVNSLYTTEHAQTAYDILASGKTIADVCAAIGISKRTYHTWLDAHAEFVDMTEAGRVAGEAYWREVARENMANPDFRESLYNSYMCNTYNVTKNGTAAIKLCAPTLMESYQKLLDMLGRAEIDSKQAGELAKVLLDGATIKERTELSDKVAELEKLLKG
jgi:transposase-like protein